MPTKRPWRSKTILANALVALLMLHPKSAALVSAYPAGAMILVSALNFLLRLITKGKVSLVDP